MKGYLFGLGAMVVGAGLMFVLMHGEVSADVQDKYRTCEYFSEANLTYCKIKDLTCVVGVFNRTLSCVKIKGGLFE